MSIASTLVKAFMQSENTRRIALLKAAKALKNENEMIEVLAECAKELGTHPRAGVYLSEWRQVFKAALKQQITNGADLDRAQSYHVLIDIARDINAPAPKATAAGPVVPPAAAPGTKRIKRISDAKAATILDDIKLSTVEQGRRVIETMANNLAHREGGDAILLQEIARMARLLEKSTDKAIAKFAENVVEMAESLEIALPAPRTARQPVVAAPAH